MQKHEENEESDKRGEDIKRILKLIPHHQASFPTTTTKLVPARGLSLLGSTNERDRKRDDGTEIGVDKDVGSHKRFQEVQL